MALTDLSRVTDTLTTLVSQVLARDAIVGDLEVNASPPEDDSTPAPNVVNIHLFHVSEDPHNKNFATTVSMTASVPVQQTPLGLVLNYVVTARSDAASATDRAVAEQRLLGFVARAFHDYPVIDDDTTIPAISPSPPNAPLLQTTNLRGNGNELHIVLRPVGLDEAINFWSAEQNATARLALFYEVRLATLRTPEAEGSAPPVLSVADFVSASNQLTLACARSLLGFSLPAGHPLADPTSPFRFIDANPARPALFPPGAPPATVPADNNRVTFEGSGFQGDRTWLSLEGPVATGAAPPKSQRFRIELSDPTNADWSIRADESRISVGVLTTVTSDQGTGFTLYPGIYRARVVVGTQIGEGPTPRFLEQSSADVGFAIVPQIESVTGMGGPPNARRFRIALLGAYLRDELEVRLNVGGVAFERGDPSQAGNYDFVTNTSAIDLAVDTSSLESPTAMQLIVNGAEAPPAWGTF